MSSEHASGQRVGGVIRPVTTATRISRPSGRGGPVSTSTAPMPHPPMNATAVVAAPTRTAVDPASPKLSSCPLHQA
ncbi:hypothetical protein BJF79_23170 [Actinomadura sp. CNU-125]|nr:hypothetical protein BJF79_23170 [Actinomadura sp. CNU-125]